MEWLHNTQTGNSKWWSWWVGLVVILIFYVILGSIPLVIGTLMGLVTIENGSILGGDANPVQFALVMISPSMLFVGTWLAQRLIHRRSLTQLTSTTQFRWPLVWQSMAIWVGLGVLFTVAEALIYPGRYTWTFDFNQWILIAPLVLLLIPIQASGEELFFRGYLMQAVARLWAQPVFLVLLSGVAFMSPHLANPEMAKALGGEIPMALNYFLVGVGTAVLSLRDNGIERAIGMHVVNNMYAGMLVGYEGSVLGTPTIVQTNVIDAWLGVVTIIIGFAVLILWPLPAKPQEV
ncbi:MAG: lysostaphin resistance A-like protein [Roseiflexaceae bacterium]